MHYIIMLLFSHSFSLSLSFPLPLPLSLSLPCSLVFRLFHSMSFHHRHCLCLVLSFFCVHRSLFDIVWAIERNECDETRTNNNWKALSNYLCVCCCELIVYLVPYNLSIFILSWALFQSGRLVWLLLIFIFAVEFNEGCEVMACAIHNTIHFSLIITTTFKNKWGKNHWSDISSPVASSKLNDSIGTKIAIIFQALCSSERCNWKSCS